MEDVGEKIREQENLLLYYLSQGNRCKKELKMTLGFYVYINEKCSMIFWIDISIPKKISAHQVPNI
ncbi:MAG: hypothetical protein HUJ74_02815 [Lachnospiraceae bacterium]|nr:hypothetical protein [Lachnospiraceae bacterium]